MLTTSSVFTRVDTQLATLSSWFPSRHGFDAFASVPDGAERSHKSWVLMVPLTEVLGGRQRASATEHGTLHRTEIRVRWLYRLRVEQRRTDLASALTAEDELRACLLATPRNPQLRLHLGPTTRLELAPSAGPMLLSETSVYVVHAIPLA